MSKNDNIEEILKNIGAGELPADVKQIAEQTSKDFEKNLTRSKQPKHFALGDYIMKTKVKLAAAAIIFIAVLIGLPFIPHDKNVALADVLEKIQQAQAFMYKMKMTMTGSMMPDAPTGDMEMEYTVTISNEYGMKMEVETAVRDNEIKTTTQTYLLPDQKKILILMPFNKQYMEMNFDEDYAAKVKQQSNDPRDMIKQILGTDYTELGQETIDGVKVQGFHTTDPAFAAGMMEDIDLTLWVDVEKWLPVRTEMSLKMNEQMQMQGVIYDYQWDVEVDPADFNPVIPEDFKAIATDYQMPKMNEEGAIEGFRFFAENTGEYPKKLNMMDMVKELSSLEKDFATDTGTQSSEENLRKTMEIMKPVQSLTMFYMTLTQEKKEPVYYGGSVGPDDVEAVLMRWKVSEGWYRVIFGDLSAMDVTAEELTELEQPLLEQ
ncbi:MAG: hypothetical protein PVH77_04875 [Phycisphaerales bacterium]|jgi:outer membrane lipoprotein-sorting protein